MILLKKSLPLLHDDTVFIDNGEIVTIIEANIHQDCLKSTFRYRQLKVWARFPRFSLSLPQPSRSLDVQLVERLPHHRLGQS